MNKKALLMILDGWGIGFGFRLGSQIVVVVHGLDHGNHLVLAHCSYLLFLLE